MKTEKQKKRNRLLLRYLFVGFLLCFLIPHYSHADGNPFDYHLLETFPGFYKADNTTVVNDLPGFIVSLYKFGIWTVGIAGLLMLTIGGFMYMSSAGNTSTASNAKGIITDAIIGIIVAMCAFLILYVINPDLTSINIAFTKAPATINTPTSTGGAAATGNPFDYHLLETFPGFYKADNTTVVNDLPGFIVSLYKFGIWTVGIAGLLMLTIGGFMYMSSAGNTSTASNAKGIITDAIIGIIVAMCAFLILYVINPDLTSINIRFTQASEDANNYTPPPSQ